MKQSALYPLAKHIFYSSLIILSSLITSCNAPDKIGQLDLVQWRSDRGGCKDLRISQIDELQKIESQLLSKHINEIGRMMGKPDIHQLAGRDQKLYVYFMQKGTHCSNIMQPSVAQKVIFKFNSIGLLAEISYQTAPL